MTSAPDGDCSRQRPSSRRLAPVLRGTAVTPAPRGWSAATGRSRTRPPRCGPRR
jgi:hypothetical protein